MGGAVRTILDRFGAEPRGASEDGERFAFDAAPLGLTALNGQPLTGEVLCVLYSEEAFGFETPAELKAAGILWIPHVKKPSELRTAVKDAHDRIKRRLKQDEDTLERLGFRARMNPRSATMQGYGEVLGSDVIVEIEPPAVLLLVEADDEPLPEGRQRVVDDAEEVGATRAHELIGERLEALRDEGVLEEKDDFDIATVRAPLPTIPSAARVTPRPTTSELEVDESSEEMPPVDISVEAEEPTGLMAAPDPGLLEDDDDATFIRAGAVRSEATEAGVAPPSDAPPPPPGEAPELEVDVDDFDDETGLIESDDRTQAVPGPDEESAAEPPAPEARPPTMVDPGTASGSEPSSGSASDEATRIVPAPTGSTSDSGSASSSGEDDGTEQHAQLPALASEPSEEGSATRQLSDDGDAWVSDERTAAVSSLPFAVPDDAPSEPGDEGPIDGPVDEGPADEGPVGETPDAGVDADDGVNLADVLAGELDDDDDDDDDGEQPGADGGDGVAPHAAEEAEDAPPPDDEPASEPDGAALSAEAAIDALGEPEEDDASAQEEPTRPVDDLDPLSLAQVAAAAAAGVDEFDDATDYSPGPEIPTGLEAQPTDPELARARDDEDPGLDEVEVDVDEAESDDGAAPLPGLAGLAAVVGEGLSTGKTGAIVLEPDAFNALQRTAARNDALDEAAALEAEAGRLEAQARELRATAAALRAAAELPDDELKTEGSVRSLAARMQEIRASRDAPAEDADSMSPQPTIEVDDAGRRQPFTEPTAGEEPAVATGLDAEVPNTGMDESAATNTELAEDESPEPSSIASLVEPPSESSAPPRAEASPPEPPPAAGVAMQDVEAFLDEMGRFEESSHPPPVAAPAPEPDEPTQVLPDVFGDAGESEIPPPLDDDSYEATQVADMRPGSDELDSGASPATPQITRVALVVNDQRARERLRKHLDPLLEEIVEFASVAEVLTTALNELTAVVLVRPPRDSVTLEGVREVGRAGPRTLVISSDDAFDAVGVDQRLPLGRKASEVAQSVLDGLNVLGVPMRAP